MKIVPDFVWGAASVLGAVWLTSHILGSRQITREQMVEMVREGLAEDIQIYLLSDESENDE